MRRGGERFSLGKPAPSRPRRRSRSTRAARGRACARALGGRRRSRSRRARVPARRPALHPLDRGRAGDRAARRGARRSTGSSPRERTGRSASPRGSRSMPGCRTRSRRRRRCSRRTSCASGSAWAQPACPSRGRGSSAATTTLPEISGPVVVKAPDRQGQKGLTLVESRERARRRRSSSPASAARSGLALVEELVDGPEVTVVGFSVDGAFTALTVTDRITAEPPAFGVALGTCLAEPRPGSGPATWPNEPWPRSGSRTARRTRSSASAPDGPAVIEVAARLGGGHDAELVEAAVGVDLNGLAIDAALGEPARRARRRPRRSAARSRASSSRPPACSSGSEVAGRRPGADLPRAGLRLRRRCAAAPTAPERCSRPARAARRPSPGRTRPRERIRFVTADAGALLQAN